ncbi:MFS transporter [Nocardioides daeguensis]|uniref:MFS transporter n=1 Tax=Nocardioides daeguensis TaxID=908359 RepID=A0ABP6UTW2_9ACTN|nr:MFS transporter [Nocardioides daeguensis]MBV6728266.1 MFS transporter [Nocardioides daeguensis]MCR1773075.1 MFS transporter [Nocardioides daeguensis]
MSATDAVPPRGTAAAAPDAAGAAEDSTRAGRGPLVQYATGSLGMGAWVTVPGLLLLYFLTNTLGVSPLVAGLALLLPKIIDAVIHPLFGTLSDRQARGQGHRRGMMRWGLLLGVAMIAMFTVPGGLHGTPAAVWVAAWYVAGNVLFAAFQVPYLTTPSDLRVGYHERTRVFMVRMVLLTVGLLVAGVLAPALVSDEQRGSYSRMALVFAVLMAATALVALRGVRRLNATCGFREPAVHSQSAVADLRLALGDRHFRTLVLSYLFTGATTHLVLAAVPFYAEHVLGRSGLTAVLMGAFLGPALVASPLWLRVSGRIGKQRGLLLAQLLFVLGALMLVVGDYVPVAFTVAVVVLLGTAFAGLQLLAFAMVPDAVAAAERRGQSRAGAYTGVWTATEAVGTAVGPYVYSAVLAVGGFASAVDGESVPQTAGAVHAILIGFTAVPAVLMSVAWLIQRRCGLDGLAASER